MTRQDLEALIAECVSLAADEATKAIASAAGCERRTAGMRTLSSALYVVAAINGKLALALEVLR